LFFLGNDLVSLSSLPSVIGPSASENVSCSLCQLCSVSLPTNIALYPEPARKHLHRLRTTHFSYVYIIYY